MKMLSEEQCLIPVIELRDKVRVKSEVRDSGCVVPKQLAGKDLLSPF